MRADFIRIGPYKSAPEQFTQDQLSDAAREELGALLDDVHQRMLADLATDLHVSQERVAQIMDEGPQLAHAARAGRPGQGDRRRVRPRSRARPVRRPRRRSTTCRKSEARSWGKQPTIGVVVVDDEIVDGDSVEIPFIDIHMTGGETIIRELDAMARDPSIRAIVLRVDSPGGAALASDKIWRAVRRAREKKPVIASMGAVAASGGYYVACAADEIWADPSTLTGSIGIFYGKVDVAQLADKLGVHVENFPPRQARRRREHVPPVHRRRTRRARRCAAHLLPDVPEPRGRGPAHDGRGGRRARARSRVLGRRALRVGLVDRLGGMASALARARQLVELAGGRGGRGAPAAQDAPARLRARAVGVGRGQRRSLRMRRHKRRCSSRRSCARSSER